MAEDQTPQVPIDLYSIKVNRMGNDELLSECLIHLKVLEQHGLTEDHRLRAITLLKEAIGRDTLKESRDDFEVALRILRHL